MGALELLIIFSLASLAFISGIAIGVCYYQNKIEKKIVGTINIDRSIPDEANLFFEVGIPIDELAKKNTVLVKVTNNNYIEK